MYAAIAKAANIQSPAVGLVIKLLLDSTIFSTVTITGKSLYESSVKEDLELNHKLRSS